MTRITAVVAIAALLQTTIVNAQAPLHTPDGWDTAMTAPLGTRVRLTLLIGTSVSGLLAEARADALIVKENKLERTFARADISKVEAERMGKPTSGKKRVLMGLAVTGAVIGGILLGVVAWCAAENSRCGA